MKKLIVLIAAVALSACGKPREQMEAEAFRDVSAQNPYVSAMEYGGHQYIVNHCGGIIHSESCPNKVHPFR